MEVGELLPVSEAFDDIFEAMLTLAHERDSNATAGRMLLRRSMQKLGNHQPYEAVRLLGRAQQHLALRECRPERVTMVNRREILADVALQNKWIPSRGFFGPLECLSMANYQICMNTVACEVLLPLPGCATSSSCSFM